MRRIVVLVASLTLGCAGAKSGGGLDHGTGEGGVGQDAAMPDLETADLEVPDLKPLTHRVAGQRRTARFACRG